ncbi:hypothetical protein GJ496_011721 [Pomphorhynchus laevis]|nr:hypothetical protein GJ496_011721 [Pomphorhynchus laevis]
MLQTNSLTLSNTYCFGQAIYKTAKHGSCSLYSCLETPAITESVDEYVQRCDSLIRLYNCSDNKAEEYRLDMARDSLINGLDFQRHHSKIRIYFDGNSDQLTIIHTSVCNLLSGNMLKPSLFTTINFHVKPVARKSRKTCDEGYHFISEEISKLLTVGFIEPNNKADISGYSPISSHPPRRCSTITTIAVEALVETCFCLSNDDVIYIVEEYIMRQNFIATIRSVKLTTKN